ncbi:hypothetical protein GN244_ATG10912 [Phytophthora infestans]|uniref:Bzip transcription factor n=1 Tax=Phytophthora infestans TaxID=4787 RepID=A0A833S0G4_PHYIN|nr:hypothetical protein GN244_ATG10912 [Phytophthora infestans]
MRSPPAFDAQMSKHVSSLSSKIVRPVFRRNFARSTDVAKFLQRGVDHSSLTIQLPTLSVPVELSSFAVGRAQSENSMSSHCNTSTLPLDTDQIRPKKKRARYRQKQINCFNTIEQAVRKLRGDIPVLELQRDTLRDKGQQDAWDVVVEYLRIFRFGVLVVLPQSDSHNASEDTKRKLAFLRSSMTDDVSLGERVGVKALMDQWQLYSSSFQSVCLQPDRIQRTTHQFVSVSATLNFTVSEATLKNVFPHLKEQLLRLKLLGQRLRVPYSIDFEWDADERRLSRVEATTNFFTPLMHILGNLADVASVLEHALLTRDGAVGISSNMET